MTKKLLVLLATTLVLFVGLEQSYAQKEPTKVYGLVGLGSADGNTFLPLGLGYQFKPHVAGEVSYMDTGSLRGYKFALVGEHLLKNPKFGLIAGLNLYYLRGELSTTTLTVESTASASASSPSSSHHKKSSSNLSVSTAGSVTSSASRGEDVVPGLGVGVNYHYTKDIVVRGGIEWIVTSKELYDTSYDKGTEAVATLLVLRLF
jgi:hypothetical protein